MIYPSQASLLYSVPTPSRERVDEAYNDWLAEFCSEDNSRLKARGMVTSDDIDDAARELVRCRELWSRRCG